MNSKEIQSSLFFGSGKIQILKTINCSIEICQYGRYLFRCGLHLPYATCKRKGLKGLLTILLSLLLFKTTQRVSIIYSPKLLFPKPVLKNLWALYQYYEKGQHLCAQKWRSSRTFDLSCTITQKVRITYPPKMLFLIQS